MEDISPEIRELIEERIRYYKQRNRAENRIRINAQDGKATFLDANAYAGYVGEDVAAALLDLPGDRLPNGMMYYNIGDKAVRPILEETAGNILDVADQVFVSVDAAAGIGIMPIRPDQSEKIQGIIDLAASKPWDEVKNEIGAVVPTFSRKVVDDSIQTNAEFHYSAGLSPKIIRTADRGACEWCREVAGRYEYEDVKDTGNDVFRRHDNCGCTVVYEPGSAGKRKVVWKPTAQQKQTYRDREKELEEQMTSSTNFVERAAALLEGL